MDLWKDPMVRAVCVFFIVISVLQILPSDKALSIAETVLRVLGSVMAFTVLVIQ